MNVLGIDPGDVAAWAYIAGILDGEGWIGAKRRLPSARNHMTSPKYCVAITLQMTDREPVEFVANACHAGYLIRTLQRQAHYKPLHSLHVENVRAVALIRGVLPYLIAKRQQADLALKLAALRAECRQHRTKVVSTAIWQCGNARGSGYRLMGLSDEYVAACDDLHNKLRRLGPRSGNGIRFGRAA